MTIDVGYPVISADSHLEVPPTAWTDRVPEAHRERAPRLIQLANGGEAVLVEGQQLFCMSTPFAERPGTGSPEQRLAEQDTDGVAAEVLFPSAVAVNPWRTIANPDAYRAVVVAYNSWLAEYCSVSPSRLIGVAVVPETGLADAIAELERCAALGLRAVVLNAFPSGRSFPTLADDDFYRRAIELKVALTIHVNMGFRPTDQRGGTQVVSGPVFDYPRMPADLSTGGQDMVRRLGNHGIRGALNAVQFVFSGAFDRIPELRIQMAENQIGWIPHFLEQFDDIYARNGEWMSNDLGLEPLRRAPSEYIREHLCWGFMRTPFGVKVRHEIGVERVMWSSDFPHGESNWPHSDKVIEEIFDGVPEGEIKRMLHDNAAEFFRCEL